MRAAAGLFLLLLGLCGSVAQAEGAGLSQVGETLRDAAEESTEQSTKFDIWAEVLFLKYMVVKLEARLRDSESQVEDLREELTVTKVHMELLQRDNAVQATELTSLETRLTDTENRTSNLETENEVQATELTSLETQLTITQNRTCNLEKENSDLQSRLSSSESELLISKSRIDQLEKEISAEATELTSLETRLAATENKTSNLEKENEVQATELTSLETQLTATQNKTSDLEKENAVQATELSSLQTRLTDTENKTSNLEEENSDLQSRLSSSESELLISKSRIDQLEKEISDKPKVAFYTALTDEGTVGPFDSMTTLKFGKVFTNTGKGYNPATGIFTAPVKGIYYFQFTAFYHVASTIGIHVLKNNQKIMYNSNLWKEQGYRYITNSVVLELMAGDEIHLALPASYSLYDNKGNYSTFSGFLVSSL